MEDKRHEVPGFAKAVLAEHRLATRKEIELEVDGVLRDFGVDPNDQSRQIYRRGLIEALEGSSPSVWELRKVGELVRLPPSIALCSEALKHVRESLGEDNGLHL